MLLFPITLSYYKGKPPGPMVPGILAVIAPAFWGVRVCKSKLLSGAPLTLCRRKVLQGQPYGVPCHQVVPSSVPVPLGPSGPAQRCSLSYGARLVSQPTPQLKFLRC